MTPERAKRFEEVLRNRQPDLTVVLENVFDPHNISAVMRTCDAVGVQEVYVLNTTLEKHPKWGFRSSRSAVNWVTVHQFEDNENLFVALRKKYQTILTAYIDESSAGLYELDLTKSTALVFGNELYGVSEAVRKLCDGSFVIPQMGMIKSLNISVACAVSLYEAYRQKQAAEHYGEQRLPDGTYKDLWQEWTARYNKE